MTLTSTPSGGRARRRAAGGRPHGVARRPARLGFGRIVAFWATTHPLHTRFANIFDTSVSGATVRPNPTPGASAGPGWAPRMSPQASHAGAAAAVAGQAAAHAGPHAVRLTRGGKWQAPGGAGCLWSSYHRTSLQPRCLSTPKPGVSDACRHPMTGGGGGGGGGAAGAAGAPDPRAAPVRSLSARKLLGWPRRCKLAHALPREYSYKGLKLAQLLGQFSLLIQLIQHPGL
jgi:hypothetical protein